MALNRLVERDLTEGCTRICVPSKQQIKVWIEKASDWQFADAKQDLR